MWGLPWWWRHLSPLTLSKPAVVRKNGDRGGPRVGVRLGGGSNGAGGDLRLVGGSLATGSCGLRRCTVCLRSTCWFHAWFRVLGDDVDAPVDYSLDEVPTRCADYIGLVPGDPGFDYSRMDPAKLEIIMSENMKSQNADMLVFSEVDSDGDVRPALGAGSSDGAEKQSEEKFVRKSKRRTLRRRSRMERRRRGRNTIWGVDEMDRWLVTSEDDPDPCSSKDFH